MKRCRTPSSRRTSTSASFREELPFDVWFTRILINGCLDRIKARTRRERWLLPMSGKPGSRTAAPPPGDGGPSERDLTERVAAGGLSPEQALLGRERRREIAEALAKLPERQRSVFVLSHVEGRTSREVSALTGSERVDRPCAPVSGDSKVEDVAGA